jgi:hypothetical protein
MHEMPDTCASPRSIVLSVGSSREARDLARLLALHGLSGHAAGKAVELVCRRERMNVVLADLAGALGTWLDDRQRDSISLTAGSRRLVYDRSGRYSARRSRERVP